MTIYISKLAAEDEDWTFDWTPKGVSVDDPIASFSAGTPVPDDLVTHSPTNTETTTTLWFSGGVPDTAYSIQITATTQGNRVYAEDIVLYVTA